MKGALRGLQGGLKPSEGEGSFERLKGSLKRASRELHLGRLQEGLKVASRGASAKVKEASKGLEGGLNNFKEAKRA